MPGTLARIQPAMLAMVLLAVAVRLFLAAEVNNYFWYGGMVSGLHANARNIADGRGFSIGMRQSAAIDAYLDTHEVALSVAAVPTFSHDVYRPEVNRLPLYPLIDAFSYRILGSDALGKAGQILADSIVPLLLLLLGRRIAAGPVATAGGFLYAVWPPFARNAVHDLPEAYVPFLLALGLLLIVRVVERPTLARAIAAGIALGLVPYFRSEWLFFVPVVALVSLVVGRERRAAIALGALCLTALVVVTPWLARGQQLAGSPFLSASTGIVLWEGLGEFPNPWGAVPDDASVGAEMRSLGIADPLVANDFYTRRVITAILRDPLVYASQVLRRLPRVVFVKADWGLAEVNTRYPGFQEFNRDGASVSVLDFFRRNPSVFLAKAVPWAMDILLVVLAVLGLVIAARRSTHAWILAAPAIFAIAFYALTHFEARYLVPALSSYCVFACVGAGALLREFTHRVREVDPPSWRP